MTVMSEQDIDLLYISHWILEKVVGQLPYLPYCVCQPCESCFMCDNCALCFTYGNYAPGRGKLKLHHFYTDVCLMFFPSYLHLCALLYLYLGFTLEDVLVASTSSYL